MKMFGSIYLITNKINSKKYVGQTIFPIAKRWKQHQQIAFNPRKKKSAIHQAILKYGPHNFLIEEVCRAPSMEALDIAEDFHINLLRSLSPIGYNLKTGGRHWQFTDEVKAKISKANKGKIAYNKGVAGPKGPLNSFYGKNHTDETRTQLSKQHSIPVIRSDGKIYLSGLEAAKDLGVIPAMINSVLKRRNHSCQGYSFNYLSEGRPDTPSKTHQRTPIVWEGIAYKSISAAAKELGIPKTVFFRKYKKTIT